MFKEICFLLTPTAHIRVLSVLSQHIVPSLTASLVYPMKDPAFNSTILYLTQSSTTDHRSKIPITLKSVRPEGAWLVNISRGNRGTKKLKLFVHRGTNMYGL